MIRGKLSGERDVERILNESRERLALALAQFQKIDTCGACRLRGMIDERAARFVIRSANSAINAKRHGIQNAANHPIGNREERQHSGNLPIALGKNIARLIAKCLLNRTHPASEMKWRSRSRRKNEAIPFRSPLGFKHTNAHQPG